MRKQHPSGFVYIWFDKKHKRYYVGSHWGPQDDGYVCSSTWMRNAYRLRPCDFKRRILQVVTTDKYDLHEAEHRWLQMMRPEELAGVRYYNQCNSVKNHWFKYDDRNTRRKIGDSCRGMIYMTNEIVNRRINPSDPVPEGWRLGIKFVKRKPLSQETKDKISAAQQGRKGHPQSEETRSKIAEKMRDRFISVETRAKISAIHKGKHVSAETRVKLRESHLGHRHSEETKRKISKSTVAVRAVKKWGRE